LDSKQLNLKKLILLDSKQLNLSDKKKLILSEKQTAEPIRQEEAHSVRQQTTEPVRQEEAHSVGQQTAEPVRQEEAHSVRQRTAELVRQEEAHSVRQQTAELVRLRSQSVLQQEPEPGSQQTYYRRQQTAAPAGSKEVTLHVATSICLATNLFLVGSNKLSLSGCQELNRQPVKLFIPKTASSSNCHTRSLICSSTWQAVSCSI
jgi:hypothetical protein